jgi:O-antigen ligase
MIDGGYAERFMPHYASRRREAPDPASTLGTDQAHNLFLHVGAETGVVGALSLLGLWLWLIAACWRTYAAGVLPLVSLGIMGSIGAFLTRSMYDNFLDNQITVDRMRVVVWSLFAVAIALDRLRRRHA